MLSPLGPAEQFGGGSRLISVSSFCIRLALELTETLFMLVQRRVAFKVLPGIRTAATTIEKDCDSEVRSTSSIDVEV